MKKIISLFLFLSLFACDTVEFPEVIELKSGESTEIIVEEEPEPLIISGYEVLPIVEENVLFYFFTDSKLLWKFTGVTTSESVKINAVLHFENSEDQTTQFLPYEFFSREGNFYYSWMIQDYAYDENGDLIQRIIKYYKQNNGIVEEIDIYEFDETPSIYYSSDYSSDNFSTSVYSIDGLLWNQLDNKTQESYRLFRQISRNVLEITTGEFLEVGLFFNVINSGIPSLSEGLYFFPKDRTAINKVKESGRLWVQGLIWEWN